MTTSTGAPVSMPSGLSLDWVPLACCWVPPPPAVAQPASAAEPGTTRRPLASAPRRKLRRVGSGNVVMPNLPVDRRREHTVSRCLRHWRPKFNSPVHQFGQELTMLLAPHRPGGIGHGVV